MDDFKVIETQEDFDRAIQKRLAQKDKEAAEQYKEYLSPDKVSALKDEYEKKASTLKDEYEKKLADVNKSLKEAQEKLANHDQVVSDLTSRAMTAESDLLKSRIAHESGVPFELAGRLVGSNEEELKADAEKFASFLAPKTAPPLHTSDAPNNTNAGLAGMLSQINSQFSS